MDRMDEQQIHMIYVSEGKEIEFVVCTIVLKMQMSQKEAANLMVISDRYRKGITLFALCMW